MSAFSHDSLTTQFKEFDKIYVGVQNKIKISRVYLIVGRKRTDRNLYVVQILKYRSSEMANRTRHWQVTLKILIMLDYAAVLHAVSSLKYVVTAVEFSRSFAKSNDTQSSISKTMNGN